MDKGRYTLLVVVAAGILAAIYAGIVGLSPSPRTKESIVPVTKASVSESQASDSSGMSMMDKPVASVEMDSKQDLIGDLNSESAAQQEEVLDKTLPAWVMNDPTAAAAFVQKMEPGFLRDKALRILAQNWSGQNPQAALAWMAQLPNETERHMFVTNTCLGLARENPSAAVRLAVTSHADEAGLLENLTQQWADKDTRPALTWAEEQNPGDERDQLIQRIALVESKANPHEAANLVLQQIPPGPVQIEAVITVVHQWGERDRNAAAAWVNQFPEGAVRERALAELDGIARYGASGN
jgi:hypothetical protein